MQFSVRGEGVVVTASGMGDSSPSGGIVDSVEF